MPDPRIVARCTACPATLDTTDLNESGREMWARFGPPKCLDCGAPMREEIIGAITQLSEKVTP
jgi:NAD-dependent SIR2 family protein deacetylase